MTVKRNPQCSLQLKWPNLLLVVATLTLLGVIPFQPVVVEGCIEASFANSLLSATVDVCSSTAGGSAAAATVIPATPANVTERNKTTNFVPFALTPVCFAFHSVVVPIGSSASISQGEWYDLLIGSKSSLADAATATTSVLLPEEIHLQAQTSAIGALSLEWAFQGSNAVTPNASRPSEAMLASWNSRLRFWNTETEVLAAMQRNTNSIGVVSLPAAISNNFSCAYVRSSSLDGRMVFVHPRSVDSQYYDTDLTAFTATALSGTTAYPLVAMATLSFPLVYNKTTNRTIVTDEISSTVSALVSSTSILGRLSTVGFFPLTQLDRIVALRATSETARVVGGTTSFQDAFASLSILGYSANVTTLPLTYAPVGDSKALDGLITGKYTVALSDIPIWDSLRVTNPTLDMIPVGFLGLNLIYLLPEPYVAVDLTLKRCTIYKIFTGAITRWDDPEIAQVNLGVALPSEAIHLHFQSEASGSTLMLTAGLLQLEEDCGFAHHPSLVASSTWPLPKKTSNLTEAIYTTGGREGMMQSLAVKGGWSIGYVGTANYAKYSLRRLSVYDGLGSSVDTLVASAVRQATYNTSTNEAKADLRIYPFVGTTYAVFDRVYAFPTRCTEYLESLALLNWTLRDPSARTALTSFGYARAQSFAARLCDVQCGGSVWFPCPTMPPMFLQQQTGPSSTVIGAAVGASGAFFLLLLIGAVLLLRRGLKRDTDFAPTDETRPFAIAFTDVQSSTSLWAAYPAEMSEAIRQHHQLIRKCVSQSNGYEVKTIGDAFMVAFRSPGDALRFAVRVQETLQSSTRTPEINQFYLENVHEECGEPWNGLRVRIGVHVGFGQIAFDEVSKGWDYYGNVVNTAARIEAAGHGGQVVVSDDLLKSVTAEELHSLAVKTTAFPPAQLRGLDAPIVLHQVLPDKFAGRRFPELRVGAESKTLEEVAAEASSTTDQAMKDVRFLQTVLSPLPKDDAKKVLKQIFSAWNIRVNDRIRRHKALGDGNSTIDKSSRRGSIDSAEVASNHSRGSQGTSGLKDADNEEKEVYALTQLVKRVFRVTERQMSATGQDQSELGSRPSVVEYQSTIQTPTDGRQCRISSFSSAQAKEEDLNHHQPVFKLALPLEPVPAPGGANSHGTDRRDDTTISIIHTPHE